MASDIQEKLIQYFNKYKEISLDGDEELIHPEEISNGIYYLKEGFVRQYTISDKGIELTLHIYQAGSFFPLTWGLNNIPIRHYFKALIPSKIIKVPKDVISDFLQQNSDVSMDLIQRLLMGIDGLLKRVEFLALGNAQSRVAAALDYLSKHFGELKNNKIYIKYRFTHEEIASIACLARETTSSNLEKLERDNIIEYAKHLIIINNPQKLFQLSKSD